MAERNSSSRTSERAGLGSRPGSRAASAGTTEQSTSGTGQTQQAGGGLAEKVKERASAQLNTQKDRATEGLGTMAQAVRQSTQQLRDQHHETIAGYVEQAANQIDRISQGLKNKDVGELARDAQRLAQRRPALFIGSAFAIGLVGARFFKSSPPDEQPYGRAYGREPYGGAAAGREYGGQGTGPFAGGYTPGTPAGSTGTAGTTGTPASPSSSRDYRDTGRS